ncbi:MAG: hypothetical protein NDP22_02350 [Crenarchaeota archaeon]|nr:hypothetical protein [Thermoproteota archaeon]
METITPGLITGLTIGLRGKDFVIIGSSKRELYGSLVISDKGSLMKFFNNRIIVCFSGHVPDIQHIFRELNWFLRTEQLQRERELSIAEVIGFLGLLMFSYKLFPNIAWGVVGGFELTGETKLYDLDPLGSVLEEDYVASGISAEVAYGLLEKEYRPDISFDNGKDLITRTLRSVAKRDVIVGKYADIAYIRMVNGVKEGKIETIALL